MGLWSRLKRAVKGFLATESYYAPYYDGSYPVGPGSVLGQGMTPAAYQRQSLWQMLVHLDQWQRRQGGQPKERLTQQRVVAIARELMVWNPLAQSIMGGLTGYTLGSKGLQITATSKTEDDSDALLVQDWLDALKDRINWQPTMEHEAHLRSHRDGDCIFHISQRDGDINIRIVDPEFCTGDGSPEFEGGIEVDPQDPATPLNYMFEWDPGKFSVVPADEVVHIKSNVDSVIKRGVSDFAGTAQLLDRGLTALTDGLKSEGSRQKTTWVTQHAPGTPAQAIPNMDGVLSETVYGVLGSGAGSAGDTGMRLYEQGQLGVSVLHLSNGQALTTLPGGEALNGLIAIVNHGLQMSAARYSMPATVWGLTNTNNAIGVDSDHPFSVHIRGEQALFGSHWRQLFWRCVMWAVELGQLPARVLDTVDIVVTAEVPSSRDPKATTERHILLFDKGAMSMKTFRTKEGLSDKEEQEQIAKEKQAAPQPEVPATVTPVEPPANRVNGYLAN